VVENMTNANEQLRTFRIRVGHWEICLKARDADEAIELARRQMARELPRLYDVIRALTASRFQVEAAA
jgi:hypothetical protein